MRPEINTEGTIDNSQKKSEEEEDKVGENPYRSEQNLELQKSASQLSNLIEQHKPILSFRERAHAALPS